MELSPLPNTGSILILMHASRPAEAVKVVGHSGTSVVLLRAPWVSGEPLRREVVDWYKLCQIQTVRPGGPADADACAALDRCITERLKAQGNEEEILLALQDDLYHLRTDLPGA